MPNASLRASESPIRLNAVLDRANMDHLPAPAAGILTPDPIPIY